MTNTQVAVLIITVPFVIAGLAWIIVSHLKRPAWDRRLSVIQLWRHALGVGFTPRQVFQIAAVSIPLVWLCGFFLDTSLLWFGALAFVAWRLATASSPLQQTTQSILNELEATATTLGTSRANIQHVVDLVSAKARELEEKEVKSRALAEAIARKAEEAAAYDTLNDQQKDLLAAVVKKAQQRSGLVTAGIILGSLSVNLAATVIWVLVGSPGREKLLQPLQPILEWFANRG